MEDVLCGQSEFDSGDNRSIYHVKNSAMQKLFRKYKVDTISDLEKAKFEVETDHRYNVWSSWGYHTCFSSQSDGEKCGIGYQKRLKKRINSQGLVTVTTDRRDCTFADLEGNMTPCAPVAVAGDNGINVSGHSWMEWGEWSHCSRTCKGVAGRRIRYRRCGTCSNPDNNNFCSNQSHDEVIHHITDSHIHCSYQDQHEIDTTCSSKLGQCLPRSNGGNRANGSLYLITSGWSLANKNFENSRKDWEGGCVDFDSETVSIGVKVELKLPHKAFAECMKRCQDAGASCLSVTFFPSLKRPYWVDFADSTKSKYNFKYNNCFMHTIRCHENSSFRDQTFLENSEFPTLDEILADQQAAAKKGKDVLNEFKTNVDWQKSAPSYYAYKDLCSRTNICDSWERLNYHTTCNSQGQNAFPAMPSCSCPMSVGFNSNGSVKISGIRAWGNTAGYNYYDEDKKRILPRKSNKNVIQRASFYTERKYSGGLCASAKYKNDPTCPERLSDLVGLKPGGGEFSCHDPCVHNMCNSRANCVYNAAAEYGYDCVCKWPYQADTNNYGPDKEFLLTIPL